jgi:hypothetical protein
LVLASAVTGVAMQSPEPPLGETRLTVHTLLREDIFAGFRADDMKRFERADRNIVALLESRPSERPNVLAWKAGMSLYRAAVAHEAGREEEFTREWAAARAGFAEAATGTAGNDGVAAITGGSYVLFSDRLPAPQRAEGWAAAYRAYSALWRDQGSIIEKLPLHHRGEVLSGMAQSSHRTGRATESAEFVDRMIAMLPDTAYQAAAKQWKAEPGSTTLTCRSCHAAGRHVDRLAAIGKTD